MSRTKTSKNVKELKIKISTNINENPFLLTYSKIHNPTSNEMPKRVNINEYPYFTADVTYPESLANNTYNELLHIFFDKQEFINVIVNNKKETNEKVNGDEKNENGKPNGPINQMEIANKNIMFMLSLLFPISYPTKNNLSNSYDKYLSPTGDTAIVNIDIGSELGSLFGSDKITAENKREYSYLNTENGICTVTELLWLNDVLNNTKYRELVDVIIEYNEWLEDQKKNTETDILETRQKLLDGLNNGELDISEEEVFEIKKLKGIYRADNIKFDIVKIIQNNVTITPGYEKLFNEKLEDMVQYFIEMNINGKTINTLEIKQLSKFIDKFDFTINVNNGINVMEDLFMYHNKYNNNIENIKEKIKQRQEIPSKLTNTEKGSLTTEIQSLVKEFEPSINQSVFPLTLVYNPNNTATLANYYTTNEFKHIFSMNEEPQMNSEYKLSDLKYRLKNPISKMLKYIFENVIMRYIRFLEIDRNDRAIAEYSQRDALIDVMIRDIEALKTISHNRELEYTKILNITESIKQTFDRLVSKNISILQTIGNKLGKIIKLSNILKFLNQIREEFYSVPQKGIFINYDKDLDKSSPFTKLFLEELKKEKYANFIKTVKFIKDNFIKKSVITLNGKLQKLMDDYFANKNNEFYTEIVENAEKIINEGLNPKETTSIAWNTSVVSMKTNNNIEYEISVYIELIQGELNPQNQSSIQCDYLDDKLTNMFEELTKKEKPLYGPILSKGKKVFSIADIETKNKEKSASSNKVKEDVTNIEKKGGSKRKTYKVFRKLQSRRYTSKRTDRPKA